MKPRYRNLTDKDIDALEAARDEYMKTVLVADAAFRAAQDKVFAHVKVRKPLAEEHRADDREYHRRYIYARRHLSRKAYSNPDDMSAEIKSLMADCPPKRERRGFMAPAVEKEAL